MKNSQCASYTGETRLTQHHPEESGLCALVTSAALLVTSALRHSLGPCPPDFQSPHRSPHAGRTVVAPRTRARGVRVEVAPQEWFCVFFSGGVFWNKPHPMKACLSQMLQVWNTRMIIRIRYSQKKDLGRQTNNVKIYVQHAIHGSAFGLVADPSTMGRQPGTCEGKDQQVPAQVQVPNGLGYCHPLGV